MVTANDWENVGYTFVNAATELRDTAVDAVIQALSESNVHINKLGLQALVLLISIGIIYFALRIANPLAKAAVIIASLLFIASFFIPSP